VGPDDRPLEIVHRDVNPSNVLVSVDGHVKLTDFGMVHMTGRMQAPTGPHVVKGKYRYLAPEYIADQVLMPQADVYGAGIMLYEMLTGELCFHGEEVATVMSRIVHEGVPYKRLDRAGVPRDLRKVVKYATERDPAKRFGTAKETYVAIENFLRKNKLYVSPSTLADFLKAANMPTQ
jgi:serine/threonine-protein kinase